MSPRLIFVLLLVTLFHQICSAQTNETAFLDAFSHISACAQTCVISAIPQSACASFTNTSCICTNTQLAQATKACLLEDCTVADSLDVAKAQADACDYPVRSMRGTLLAPLAIELLAFPAVLLRLYGRWRYAPRYEVDDWIMVVCFPIWIVFEILGHYIGQLGFGLDIWEVDQADFTFALKLFYADESLYLAVLVLTKLAMLFCFLRIFPQKTFRRVCYGLIAWVALSGTIFVFLQIFQCVPISFVWEGWLLKETSSNPHRCLNVHALAYAAGATSIAQDAAILVAPMPLLRNLHTTARLKLEVCLMFSLGFFILLTSCIRLGFIVRFAQSSNPSWDNTGPLIWSGLECAVSMIVTSLPAIRHLSNSSRSRRLRATGGGKAAATYATGGSSSRGGYNSRGYVRKGDGGSAVVGLTGPTLHLSESQIELDHRKGVSSSELEVE